MTIVTTGNGTSDIDALACSVAYTELLKLQGQDALAAINTDCTESVTAAVRNWGYAFKDINLISAKEADAIVIVDYSDPRFLPQFVAEERIIKLFDHHYFGHEEYWPKKLGKNSVIEPVGSCASLIWREWQSAEKIQLMSVTSARLLYTAIISNTLNFKASVTTELDINAAFDLQKHADLPEDWVATYYAEIEGKVLKDPINAIAQDTRIYIIKQKQVAIGQLELFNGKEFVEAHLEELNKFVKSRIAGEVRTGFLTIPSIKDGHNYIIVANQETAALLRSKFRLKDTGTCLQTEKLFLRKEIFKLLNS